MVAVSGFLRGLRYVATDLAHQINLGILQSAAIVSDKALRAIGGEQWLTEAEAARDVWEPGEL